jgi:hypothetical protein
MFLTSWWILSQQWPGSQPNCEAGIEGKASTGADHARPSHGPQSHSCASSYISIVMKFIKISTQKYKYFITIEIYEYHLYFWVDIFTCHPYKIY